MGAPFVCKKQTAFVRPVARSLSKALGEAYINSVGLRASARLTPGVSFADASLYGKIHSRKGVN